MRILIIEDETTLREQIGERLSAEGYTVDASGDGKEGLFIASEYPLDLAVIDLGLPGMPGLEIIRTLRSDGHTLPILILTARGKWEEKVTGLEAGADDYLVKPFHMEELLARIKALLRRSGANGQEAIGFGPIRLDSGAQKLTLNDAPLELTAYDSRRLEDLIHHRDKVIPKSELADYLYPHEEDRDSNVIEVLIGRLRRKLDPDGVLKPIETLRGRGYRFTLEPA